MSPPARPLRRTCRRTRWELAGAVRKTSQAGLLRDAPAGNRSSTSRMCGIVGYVGSKPLMPVLIEGLRRLEYRGYDSAGVAVVRNGQVEVRRSAGKLSRLEDVLAVQPLD